MSFRTSGNSKITGALQEPEWPRFTGGTQLALAKSLAERPRTTSVALVITDLSCNPLYASRAAIEILSYQDHVGGPADSRALIKRRIQSILKPERHAGLPPPTTFLSGKRHYVCRPYLLQSQRAKADRSTVVLLLEREPRVLAELFETSRLFHFTPREFEVIALLIDGLTTKQIAQDMQISPNTVKAFLRLVMSKMGVTTRSGIIGKILSIKGSSSRT